MKKQFFKVVTGNMKSLGLKNNKTILKFSLGKWVKSPTIKKGISNDGGIWVAASLSAAKRLKKYMMNQYGKSCKIFKVLIGKILFKNTYRIKTDKVWFEEEVL